LGFHDFGAYLYRGSQWFNLGNLGAPRNGECDPSALNNHDQVVGKSVVVS
jgi:hypothetical protein